MRISDAPACVWAVKSSAFRLGDSSGQPTRKVSGASRATRRAARLHVHVLRSSRGAPHEPDRLVVNDGEAMHATRELTNDLRRTAPVDRVAFGHQPYGGGGHDGGRPRGRCGGGLAPMTSHRTDRDRKRHHGDQPKDGQHCVVAQRAAVAANAARSRTAAPPRAHQPADRWATLPGTSRTGPSLCVRSDECGADRPSRAAVEAHRPALGSPTEEDLVKNHRQRPDVRSTGRGLAGKNLGSHVVGRADQHRRARARSAASVARPKSESTRRPSPIRRRLSGLKSR